MKAPYVPKRPRKRKKKNGRGFPPSYDRTLIGPVRVTEAGRDVIFPTLGRMKRSFFTQTSTTGNFIDPNSHTWMKLRIQYPNGHICLDFDTSYYSHWRLFHSFYSNSYYSMDDTSPYVNSERSLATFAGDVRFLAEAIAIRKFLRSLRDSESQFAVDIAEAKKSYDMIHHRVVQIVDLARSVRRKAFAISRRNPNDPNKAPWAVMAKTWLEYKYGWSPLVSSAFGLADAVRKRSKNGKFRITQTHHYQRIRNIKKTNDLGFSSVMIQTADTYATVSSDYVVDCAWLQDASRFVGLNPLSIIWELVPYSFVADWFIDIGGYLQDFETSIAPGLTFKRGYTTFVHNVNNEIHIPAQKSTVGGRTHVNFDNLVFTENFRHKERTRLYSTVRPVLPSFDTKLGASRIISGAALLLNLLTKFNPRDRFNDRIKFDPWGPGWKYF